ncbi:MAG: hypothetical protein ACHQK9_20665 [Reyranellales bacterium]
MTGFASCSRAGAIVLALLLPGVAHAQSPSACDTVAHTVLAVQPPGPDPWQSPVRTLDKASAGVVSIDADEWRAEAKDQGLDKLRREYRAAPDLLKSIADLTRDSWLFTLYRFGTSSLRLAEVTEGSGSCHRFAFFDAPSTAESRAIAAPPAIEHAEPFAFCYSGSGHAGEIGGVPAFIGQIDQGNTAKLSISPWRDGAWQPECKVVIQFSNVFEATDRFCKDVDCREMANQALSLARKLDQDPHALDEAANSQGDKFQAMKELPPPGLELPTFGGKVHNRFQVNTIQFAPEWVVLPVVVGGETYLGRLGHPAVGWRTYPDYLFDAYKMVGSSLEPVAGIYISKTRDRPVSATTN